MKLPTNVRDITDKMIFLGDILQNYESLFYVCLDEEGFYLSLITGIKDICRNKRFSLNKDNQYKVVYSQ